MGKCYIEFKKVKNKNGEAEFKNIKLKIDGLLIKRSFSIENEEKLIEDLKNKNVTYEKKNGKRVITDKDLVLKYSKKANKVSKQNKYKKAIFATATISALAMAALFSIKKGKDTNSGDNNKHNIETTTTEENTDIDNNEVIINYDEKSTPSDATYINATTENINVDTTSEIIPTEIINDDITNDANYTFDVYYEDRSTNECVEIIKEKYSDYIEKYSEMYGIDKNLVVDIIAQENKDNEKNYTDEGGYGLMQVESLWNGHELYAYNFIDEEYDCVVVDTARARDDDEYAIKVGCMIYNSYYQYIRSEYCINNNTLTEEECIIAALFAYNKGITLACDILDYCNNLEEYLNDISKTSDGDNEYIENVLSYQAEKIITIKNIDGSTTSIGINIKDLSNDNNIKM